jgi:cell division protein FtsW
MGFQLLQALIAIGSGGVLGLGPGNSLQKLHFLPSPHADFVFAIVGEEYGLVGALILIVLFGLLAWRGLVAGLNAPDTFGRYLAWGCTVLLVFQALIHMSVATGMVPTTGVPLPFISHGGTSLLASLIAAGVLLNVSQHG